MNQAAATLSGTSILAGQASRLRFDDIPAAVVTVAKQCILDTVGVSIAGADDPGTRMVRKVALSESGSGECSIFGVPGERAAPGAAALANGVAAHVLDLDDVLTAFTGHPSVPVLPAVFALAEDGRRSGKDLIEAFVVGVEVEARVGASVAPSHYRRGFHATGTIGTFGAAAAAGRMLGLDAKAMEAALGIAAAQAAGLKCEFGTMTKSLHAGKAAANGLFAARLASLGFTSASDVVACARGFADAQSDGVNTDVLTAQFGSPWYLLDTLFKRHASCHYTHSVFEAIRSLRDNVAPDDVETLTLRVNPDLLDVCDLRDPQTGLEAKFSMRYVAALSLAHGVADPSRFTDESVLASPELLALAAKVEVIPDENVPHFTSLCRIERTGGGRFEATHDSEHRAWRDDPQEQSGFLLEKFASLAGPVCGDVRAAELSAALMRLEDVDDVSLLLKP